MVVWHAGKFSHLSNFIQILCSVASRHQKVYSIFICVKRMLIHNWYIHTTIRTVHKGPPLVAIYVLHVSSLTSSSLALHALLSPFRNEMHVHPLSFFLLFTLFVNCSLVHHFTHPNYFKPVNLVYLYFLLTPILHLMSSNLYSSCSIRTYFVDI